MHKFFNIFPQINSWLIIKMVITSVKHSAKAVVDLTGIKQQREVL